MMQKLAAAVGVVLALCGCAGNDDHFCGYSFGAVPTMAECVDLQAELNCATQAFTANDATCQLGGCLACAAAEPSPTPTAIPVSHR
jgi:hypothetical protein